MSVSGIERDVCDNRDGVSAPGGCACLLEPTFMAFKADKILWAITNKIMFATD